MPATRSFFNSPAKLAGKTMSALTGKGPEPTLLTAPPDSNSTEIQAVLAREKELAQRRTGRRATILTEMGANVGGKTLLGS